MYKKKNNDDKEYRIKLNDYTCGDFIYYLFSLGIMPRCG